jgi:hypothetical protein
MIERKCEITRPFHYLLRSLVNMMLAVKPRIREISESDIDAIADLLTRDFVHRSREYWMLAETARNNSDARLAARLLPQCS